jgi:hypothetical protein
MPYFGRQPLLVSERGHNFPGQRLRKFLIALITTVLLAAPAYAQSRGKGSKHPEAGQQTEDKKKKDTAAEKAYKDALRSIPNKKISDPWTNMR